MKGSVKVATSRSGPQAWWHVIVQRPPYAGTRDPDTGDEHGDVYALEKREEHIQFLKSRLTGKGRKVASS
jgi:hypothetical protein